MSKDGGREAMDYYFHQIARARRHGMPRHRAGGAGAQPRARPSAAAERHGKEH